VIQEEGIYFMLKRLFCWIGIVSIITSGGFAGQRSDRKKAEIEESASPRGVSGGIKFQVTKPYEQVYDGILNELKKLDYTIESANKDAGQIVTEMTIKGGYSQTGSRIYAIFIRDSDMATTVRVAMSEQKRKKLLSTEPWSEPKVNETESVRIAEHLRAAFQ
jgi:hypothetical protein